ncbi:hypothetical protein FRC11_001068 [Ceratobasidium sp. 423]|nr:hypothetical protein FRC11_001068 [Ceratobasidium sp. 423]
MMMFLGNEEKVYILDKVEGNPSQINGHPAWGVEWDIASSTATLMDIPTNSFCAAGMHFPNGSWATFGGNAAVGPGGKIGSMPNPDGLDALYDATYQDWDGRRAIRVLNPCTSGSAGTPQCQWFDNTTYVGMQKARWYASTEALADGSIVIVGGYVNGGYINRNTPNVDPAYSGGAAEPTFEFWPNRGTAAAVMQFMITTSGLNSYAHLYLMPSGRMFAQANFSTNGSVLVAGSNPNVDVNLTTAFPTTYTAERFYPPYFANISTRPVPEGLPETLSYGGAAFQVYLPLGSFVGDPNEAAGSARVVLVRPGFSTHAMNMGQRLLQLDSTFEVSDDGNIVLHVSQVPPNPNLLTPGPVLMFIVVGGVPSVGKMIRVGTGQFGTQPVQAASFLPPPRARPTPSPSTAAANADSKHSAAETRTRVVAIVVALGAVLIAALVIGIYLIRKRRGDNEMSQSPEPSERLGDKTMSAPLWPGVDSQDVVWTPYVNGPQPPRAPAYESSSSTSLGPIVSPARTYSGLGR